jgi:hypothetical protein
VEERPISSRMQELLQRAADERQAEQHRQGETVESLRTRVDELSDRVVAGHERLTEKIDATFALTASTVEILQRIADRVDSLERSLDDITMRLGSISWRMDEVRDGEGRLAERIDESALALAEAMFATGRSRRPDSSRRDADAPMSERGVLGLVVADAPSVEPARDDAEETRYGTFHPARESDEQELPSFASTAARFQPPSPDMADAPATPPATDVTEEPEPAEPTAQSPAESIRPIEPEQPSRPDADDPPYANVVDLPSTGRTPIDPDQPAEDVGGGRPLWGPSGDFLGSRPTAVAATAPATAVFEFPAESGEPADAPAAADDEEQDFFDRWAPRPDDTVVAEPAPEVATAPSPVREPESTAVARGLGGTQTGARFLREVSAARESQDATRPVEAAAAADTRATDDTVPPEWFASYFRNDARSGSPNPAPNTSAPGPAPLPGSRPAPGSA